MSSKYNLAAKAIAAIFRTHQLTYATSKKVVQEARHMLGMIPDTAPQRLPQMPGEADIENFWKQLERGNNLRDIILVKLTYLTGARNSEIRHIRKDQVDLDANKIYIYQGKGKKDRYVVYPDSFSLPLRAYIQTLAPACNWLFPNSSGSPITARRLQQIVSTYAAKAGVTVRLHPHKMRHMLLTKLTEAGMPDAQIQLISGHANRESLKIYQHVGLPGVQDAYEKAMSNLAKTSKQKKEEEL